MKRRITLYLGNHAADLADDGFVLMNYALSDLTNPAVVKNSWSQSVALPRTPKNTRILGSVFRADRVNASGFNPRLRAPFKIFDASGDLLESGYFKLENTTGARATGDYNIVLYGGLGSLLYGLSYDSNGDALTLADLDYLQTADPDTELDFTINRTTLLGAWQDLEQPGQATIFGVVNFAPAYNGIPEDFAADKCLFNLETYVSGSTDQAIANLSKKYTEREMGDYRSYLQRPVVKVSAVLDAIVRAAADLGYTLDLTGWCYAGNDYENDVWMTLPMLKGKRSGDTITKADLLGGTMSPADFLLGIVKTFGLVITCDHENVALMKRDDFYLNETIDLTERIDTAADFALSPLALDAKWYEFSAEDDGDFAKTYKEKRGRIYGSQRINTGYDFDAAVKQLAEGIKFRGAVQSQEFSTAFRLAYALPGSGGYSPPVPAPFLDGGTYNLPDGAGSQTAHQLVEGIFATLWWNPTYNGYDEIDLPQLHGADNKTLDGSGVLLFYTGQPAVTAPLVVSDDNAAMGEEPCWNFSSLDTDPLTILPHFSRFLLNGDDDIYRALDWGPAAEVNVPALAYAGDNVGLYADFWRAYLADRFNENTKTMKARVRLDGLKVGADLLRRFFWYRGSLWVLASISNYSLTTFDPAECEFVQVRDKDAYLNGQY